jgi:DNA-directed RNA polymerase subunit RPC12/RpoP
MDIIFNCKECGQELSVDSEAAGSEFNCPTCGTQLVVPDADGVPASGEPAETAAAPRAVGGPVVNAIKTSAAAKEEHHFKVALREHASESLIQKPNLPLEVAAKEAFKIKVKTIRHSDCVEVGHDKFDEIVTKFLNQIGEGKLVSMNTITYQYIEIGSQKVVTDFGVMIVYHTT